VVLNVLFTVSKLQPHYDCLAIYTQHIPQIRTFFPPSNKSELVVVSIDKIYILSVYISFKDVGSKVFVAFLANLLEKDKHMCIIFNYDYVTNVIKLFAYKIMVSTLKTNFIKLLVYKLAAHALIPNYI